LFQFERVEERAVLVVLKSVVDFLVPDHAPVGRRDIDELDPKGISYEIVGQHRRTLETGIRPSVAIWMRNIEPGNRDGLYFVGRFRDGALDNLLVSIREDGWHGGEVSRSRCRR